MMNERAAQVTATHVTDLLSHAKRDACMGRMLHELGRLTPEDVERVLCRQQERCLRFGEAALELGLITESDIQEVLARQFDYAYLRAEASQFQPGLVAAHRPFSEEVEALRALRSQLKLRWFDAGRKTLALVSVDAEGEASMLAANLGVVFSQAGMRTLIVDANLRRPRQHDIFGLKARQGLSDLLAKRAGLDRICQLEPFPNLCVLPAGTLPPNPQELLSRDSFGELRHALTARFDVTLYDVPAFSAAADTITVAARAGGALLVASKDNTRLTALNAACEHLQRVQVEVLGSVLVEPGTAA